MSARRRRRLVLGLLAALVLPLSAAQAGPQLKPSPPVQVVPLPAATRGAPRLADERSAEAVLPAGDVIWCDQPAGGTWAVGECPPGDGPANGGGSPPASDGTWTPGTLEIHVLNVGQGETQLIIGPTGRTLLIGVFEASWNTSAGAQWLAGEIRRITGGSHVDYVMPSHWHLDHMGYAGYGGIWSLIEEQGITAGALIDRDGGVWDDANGDGICDPDLEVVWHNAGTTSGTARNWVCWATDPATTGGQIRQLAQVGSTTQIDLGLSEGLTTRIVQADAQGVMMADGVTPLQGDHTADALPPSENDYSITLWLNWGRFDYVAGGDTDGEYATGSFGYMYNDVESSVAARIGQEVEVMWVNHHGSTHSTNPAYLTTLSPAVALYSVGSNTYGHPDQRMLDALYNHGTKQYFPQSGDPSRNYHDAVFANGNLVVRTADGINYTVHGDAYVAADPGAARVPAVGEVVINEYLPAPSAVPHEFVELYNTTGDALDIGGLWIDDLAGAGSAPRQIAAGTTLPAGGYYVYGLSDYLNNTGDDVRLLGADGVTVYDATSYTSAVYDLSYCRLPDGGPWASGCTPSEGTAN